MIARPFTRRISRSAGPQALAVLSCALALLAVNPSSFNGAQSAPAPLTRVQGQLPTSEPAIVANTPVDATTPATPFRSTRKTKYAAKTNATQSSAILQTVAFLNAALISHFTPLTTPAVFSPCVQTVSVQVTPSQVASVVNSPLPQPHEQAFALAHCLLAPPV